MARPRLPKGPPSARRFTKPLTLRFEDGQLDIIQKAADIARLPRERFMRNMLMEAAERTIKEHGR